jgi:hypothetical protein
MDAAPATGNLPEDPEKAPIAKKCSGVDCPNDAGQLQCPNCLKLGKESFFCGQDCFKRSWVGIPVPCKVLCSCRTELY